MREIRPLIVTQDEWGVKGVRKPFRLPAHERLEIRPRHAHRLRFLRHPRLTLPPRHKPRQAKVRIRFCIRNDIPATSPGFDVNMHSHYDRNIW